jgi:hypothetical protein
MKNKSKQKNTSEIEIHPLIEKLDATIKDESKHFKLPKNYNYKKDLANILTKRYNDLK